MKQNFGVGLRTKSMSFLNEFFTQFDVIEDLTVECDPQRAVGIRHRLTAACEIDNAQSRVSKAETGLDVDASIIGAAMIEHHRHRGQAIHVNRCRFGRHDAGNAAHSSMSVLSKAVAMVPLIPQA
jgi:hypothetical protein